MKAIVTVKLERNPKHNPHNKVIGDCPLYENTKCSDVTGEHHSYLEEAEDENMIWVKARRRYKHITRVEVTW